MKQQVKPFIVSLGLLGLISAPVFAETADSQQLERLEKQMAQMQQEMKVLKAQLREKSNRSSVSHKARQAPAVRHQEMPQPQMQELPPTPAAASENTVINAPPYTLPKNGIRYLPVDLDTPGQSFVSTGPYLGVPIEYSGSNLVINNPNINEDVSLLKLRKNINTRLAELGIPHPEDHAHLLLSGLIEGQASVKSGGTGADTSDIDLTSAKLDAYILGPSSWTSALMTFAYDNNTGATTGVITTQHRVANSRVFIDKAFITIGDFTKSPFYGSIGQMYLPFGTYSTNLVTSPLTKTLARVKDRALLLGYQGQGPDAFYTSAYLFKGDSYMPSTIKKINNGGINVGYRFKREQYNSDFGAGVIGNIADSVGMQDTNNQPLFGGFGNTFNSCGPLGTGPCGNEQLVHRVPAYDLRGLFAIGKRWNFIAEYIRSATHFSVNNLSYNSHGAQPQALNTELAYTFTVFNRPASIVGGYGMTKEALAIGLPAKRYSLVVNTSIWRDTLQSLELRHDIDYGTMVTSTGQGILGPTGTGRSDNVITAQFDIYF